MATQITLPPTRAVGDPDPPVDMNLVTAALGALNATSWVFPTGDTSGASDSANINAAVAANGLAVLGSGTWYMNATAGPFVTNQWVICQPGVFINWKGTGDCFRWVDTSTYTARTVQGGGITGRPVIDGTSDGAGSSALHAGDILGFRFDIAAQNFSKSGDIGVHLDNQNYWTEQAIGTAYINNCSQSVVLDCGGASTSTGSYDRGDLTFYLSVKTFTGDVVTFQNGAQLLGGRLRLLGNINSSSSAFTHAVLKLTGSTPGGHSPATNSSLAQCGLDINVESDLGLANTYQTVNFGATTNTILDCTGNISFGAGNQFGNSNITSVSSQFSFNGQVVGDTTLGQQTIDNRLSVNGQTFIHSSLFLQEISAPGTPSGGGDVYVDGTGHLTYKGPSGTVTVLANP